MGIKFIGRSSFDALYMEKSDMVYQIVYSYSNNHHVAEEITQSVFMKLFIHMDNINQNHIEAWLNTTAKHMTLNYLRKYKREELVPEIDRSADKLIYLDSIEDRFVDNLARKQRADLIEEIYAELYEKNERWYEAMTVTLILEKPHKEVAEMMNVSVGALHLMLHRAKKWVEKRYRERFEHLDEA